MRLFILSLLAVSSVYSSAIGNYPYRTQLWAYSPARGEFDVQSASAQGYIRYIDPNGAERLVRYSYPDPLQGVRRLSYGTEDISNPLLKSGIQSFYSPQQPSFEQRFDYNEQSMKERDEHFRLWCEQRYNVLKAEMDKLRAEGLKPTPDLLAQIKPLEQIITGTATTYSGIDDTPEVKRAREEHLRIWNEARLKVLALEAEHLRQQGKQPAEMKPIISDSGELKTYAASYEGFAPIGETPEQKKVREEHLRFYNEQLQRIKQLEAEREALRTQEKQRIQEAVLVKEAQPIQTLISNVFETRIGTEQQTQQQPQPVQDTPEVIRAREEHLKFVSEAKLKAQSETTFNSKDDGSYKEGAYKEGSFKEGAYKEASFQQNSFKAGDLSSTQINKVVPGVQQPNQAAAQEVPSFKASAFIGQQPAPVQDTPEVIRAREEHLRLVNEAKLKASQYKTESEGYVQPEKVISYSGFEGEQKLFTTEVARLSETERLQEAERIREEEKLRETERLREEARVKEEQRMLEEERIRLRFEEERRIEMERLEETKRIKEEERLREAANFKELTQPQEQQIIGQIKSEIQPIAPATIAPAPVQVQDAGFAYKGNPFLLRFSGQPIAAPFNAEKPILPRPITYYLPATGATPSITNPTNPFLIRYVQETRPELIKQRFESASLIAPTPTQAPQKPLEITFKADTKPIAFEKFATNSASDMKINYGQGASFSELEKATREHFRAHELALENLRLANANSQLKKDC